LQNRTMEALAMKKKAPLMVVATLNPDNVNVQLARYSTPDGDFITTAGLEYVFSPYDGKEIAGNTGKETASTLDGDKAIGVQCRSCKSINATLNTTRSEMHCVVCGTHMRFDVNAEAVDPDTLDDVDPTDVSDEDTANGDIGDDDYTDMDEDDKIGGDNVDASAEDDIEDAPEVDDEDKDPSVDEAGVLPLLTRMLHKKYKKYKAKKKAAQHSSSDDPEVDEEDELDGDDGDAKMAGIDELDNDNAEGYIDPLDTVDVDIASEDDGVCDNADKVVDMTDLVDEDAPVAFLQVQSKVVAMVSEIIVASMPENHENAKLVVTSGFANGFKKTVSAQGLNRALVSAGFKPKRVLIKAIAQAATVRASKEADRKVQAKVSSQSKRFGECIEIATAGSMLGMFTKEKANVLFEELSKVLANVGVVTPKKVAKSVLSKALAQHNKAIIRVATDLMNRSDSVLSTYKEQISDMSGSNISAFEDEVPEDDEDSDVPTDDTAKVNTVESRLGNPLRVAKQKVIATPHANLDNLFS
jgi:hypothetical protein